MLILRLTRKGTGIAKTILKKKFGGFTPLDFKTNYEATIIKTVWEWWKVRHRSMERLESCILCTYGENCTHTVNWFLTKNSFSLNKGVGPPCVKRKKKSWPILHILHKGYLKIGNRSKYKIIKPLEETQEKKFHGPGQRFLRYDLKSMIYRRKPLIKWIA